MPSRAAAAGPGGFSFYDHVCLSESLKDLTWAHEGRSYRSQIVIRNAGKRRTEAYLHVVGDDGGWRPVTLEDGTVSDGKVATYERCVEAICGSADTFFTSVFAAQGKRALSAYKNAEIKSLLADLLGQAQIQTLGQKASETARLLRAGLAVVRQDAAGIAAEAQRLDAERLRLEGAPQGLQEATASRAVAQHALDEAQALHARLAALKEQSAGVESRRQQLRSERQAVADSDEQAKARLQKQDRDERERLQQLECRIAGRLDAARKKRLTLERARQRCRSTLEPVSAVQHASNRLPLAERVLAQRTEHTRLGRERAQLLARCEADIRLGEQRLAALEQEAGRAALDARDLAARFGLTGEVPCSGTDLQGRCKLLGDARAAQVLIPSAQAQIERVAGDITSAKACLAVLRIEREALADALRGLSSAERREDTARTRLLSIQALAARLPACDQARAELEIIDEELRALGPVEGSGAAAETDEEKQERSRIYASRQAMLAQTASHAEQVRAALERIDGLLASLPARFDDATLTAAGESVAQSRAAVLTAEQAQVAALRDVLLLKANREQQSALAERRSRCDDRRAHIEDQLGNWALFARCMSNDGLIALAIDDAGPELSGLANDLLLASYGARFTVSIQTLLQTATGDQREGFDILVHDAESAESKSLVWMSGGERTIIEACLTRAIALYLAQSTGRRYSTLFSDEADGALDPDRKRRFMAMKREVLRLGGYEREYFISQTPELTAMADAVIDLDRYVLGQQGTRAIQAAAVPDAVPS
ncbi:MAG: DNA repair protein [Burkholderiales bacterium]|nr:DNA repair protein [Burkholderiales bacterium]